MKTKFFFLRVSNGQPVHIDLKPFTECAIPAKVINLCEQKKAYIKVVTDGKTYDFSVRTVVSKKYRFDVPGTAPKSTKPKTEKIDPVMSETFNFAQAISDSVDNKPDGLLISDLKWKYLVRSVLRGKNIMMTGPSGCGKTFTAQQVAAGMNHPFFYFNLGATQDPRTTLIGNTQFREGEGTFFNASLFVQAIQTENAIILLDEISRAHPEAWNILMTVLDEGQRYMRLDEQEGAPTVKVAKGVSFIATANIGVEFTAARVMDRALFERFVIIEVEQLDHNGEVKLITNKYPNLATNIVDAIAGIADGTRTELKSSTPRITTSLSTRSTLELAGLCNDGFTLEEGAEVAIYPFFSNDGGTDSERTFVRQLTQKFLTSDMNSK